jgi:AraC-like DNA-binding protein/uncharacterized RmlC-like cupin family protein
MAALVDDPFGSPRHTSMPGGLAPLWASVGTHDSQVWAPDIHIHHGVELGVILSGRHDILFGDYLACCAPGDVWLCNAFEPHGSIVRSAPCRYVVLVFDPAFIGEEMAGGLPWLTLFAMPPELRPRPDSLSARRRVRAIAQDLAREVEETPRFWEEVVRLRTLEILVELARERDAAARQEIAPHGGLDALAQVMPALSLMHTVPWRRVPAPEAAAACGLSLSAFHRLFHRTMGMSYAQFGVRARLMAAVHRVANTNRSLSTIAVECGFTDRSHLHSHFIRQYGCTPSEYRRRLRLEGARIANTTGGVVGAEEEPEE